MTFGLPDAETFADFDGKTGSYICDSASGVLTLTTGGRAGTHNTAAPASREIADRRRTDPSRPTMDPGDRRADAAKLPSDAGDVRLGVLVPADGPLGSALGRLGIQLWAAAIGAPVVEDPTPRPKHWRSEVASPTAEVNGPIAELNSPTADCTRRRAVVPHP